MNQSALLESVVNRFRSLYGDHEAQVWRAPARINILGEHVDYVSYLPTASLPFGSHEHQMVMAVRANNNGVVRGASLHSQFQPFEFAIPSANEFSEKSWTDYLYGKPIPPPDWSNYVKGAVYFAAQKFGVKTGFNFVVGSSIPPQGGSSSSSALVVLTGVVIRSINRLKIFRKELAQDSAQAEWFIGTRGGALDHTTICLAKRDHAVHLQYENNQATRIPLPSDGYRWVTFFSQAADKGREIMLEYNERAAVARLLIPAIIEEWKTHRLNQYSMWEDGKDFWRVGVRGLGLVQSVIENFLPETLTLNEAQTRYPEAYQQCLRAFPALIEERFEKPLKLRDRALHHIGEIDRVEQAVKILNTSINPDEKMQRLGQLVTASHESLRDLYDVSTPDVEKLIRIIRSDENVLGARLIGGGFGGNVLALTKVEFVNDLLERVQREYYAPQQRNGVIDGAVMVSTAGDGVENITTVLESDSVQPSSPS